MPKQESRPWDSLTAEEQAEITAAWGNWKAADLWSLLWEKKEGHWSGRDNNLLAGVFSVPRRKSK